MPLMQNRYFIVSIILVVVQTVLLIIYAVTTYALLHSSPEMTKNETNGSNSAQMINDHIFIYKKNQERSLEIKLLLKKQLSSSIVNKLKREYINLYQQPTFCDSCEFTKPSRAYHCLYCNRCILRREKHSDLMDGCIGQGNIKVFVQYMFISFIISGYMIVTLIVISLGQHHQLNDLNSIQLCLFAFQEMVLCSCFALSIKEFSVSYYHIVQNLTQTQIDQGIINKTNNPFKVKQEYYRKVFQSKWDYFDISHIGQFNHWLQMQENN